MFLVYKFDPGLDDFDVCGGFTKREDADALKAELEAAKAKCVHIGEGDFGQALDQHLKARLGAIAAVVANLRLASADHATGQPVWVLTCDTWDGGRRTDGVVVGVFTTEEAARDVQRKSAVEGSVLMCQRFEIGSVGQATA